MSGEVSRRKHPRLAGYDYSSNGAYFVTVCTQGKKKLLCTVGRDDPGAPPEIILTPYGEIADQYIRSISSAYTNVSVEKYVIMPNHVHLLLSIGASNGAPGSSRPTVPQIIVAWKRFVHRECGQKLFQTSYHDHIIRDEADFLTRWKYIDENPAKWESDDLFQE